MTTSAERREREKREVRRKILDAARELFAAEGVDAVSMRKIADRIGYSATALYFHFADRRALLRELCDHDFRAFAAELPKVARIKDPVERLRRAGQTYVQFAMEHPGQYRFMFMTPAGIGPEESTAEQGNPEQDAYAFLRACVAEAIAAGRLRPEIKDVELVSQLLWAAVHGLVSLHIAKGRERWVDFRPIKRSADVLIDAILRGLTR